MDLSSLKETFGKVPSWAWVAGGVGVIVVVSYVFLTGNSTGSSSATIPASDTGTTTGTTSVGGTSANVTPTVDSTPLGIPIGPLWDVQVIGNGGGIATVGDYDPNQVLLNPASMRPTLYETYVTATQATYALGQEVYLTPRNLSDATQVAGSGRAYVVNQNGKPYYLLAGNIVSQV